MTEEFLLVVCKRRSSKPDRPHAGQRWDEDRVMDFFVDNKVAFEFDLSGAFLCAPSPMAPLLEKVDTGGTTKDGVEVLPGDFTAGVKYSADDYKVNGGAHLSDGRVKPSPPFPANSSSKNDFRKKTWGYYILFFLKLLRENEVDSIETADTEYILLKTLLLEALAGNYVPGTSAEHADLLDMLRRSAQTPQIMHTEKSLIEGLLADPVAFALYFGPEMVESFQHKAKKIKTALKKVETKLEKLEKKQENAVLSPEEEAESNEFEVLIAAIDLANAVVESSEGGEIADLCPEEACKAAAAVGVQLESRIAAQTNVEEKELERLAGGLSDSIMEKFFR